MPNESTEEIGRLERDIVKYAMQRLRSWKKEHPEGLHPKGHPQACRHESGRKMIEACLALEKLRAR